MICVVIIYFHGMRPTFTVAKLFVLHSCNFHTIVLLEEELFISKHQQFSFILKSEVESFEERQRAIVCHPWKGSANLSEKIRQMHVEMFEPFY